MAKPDIIDFLKEKYPEFCTEKEICKASDLSPSTVSTQMQRLIEENRVRKERQGFRLVPTKEEEFEAVARKSPEILRKEGQTVLPNSLYRFTITTSIKLGIFVSIMGIFAGVEILHTLSIVPVTWVYIVAAMVAVSIVALIVSIASGIDSFSSKAKP